MFYQGNTIRLYICLIANSIKKEFILINTYIYIKVTTKKLKNTRVIRNKRNSNKVKFDNLDFTYPIKESKPCY
jgi:hypothetical protein